MMRLSLLWFLIFPGIAFGQEPGKNNVVTHNRATVVTNPKTGENFYPKWGVFPAADVSVRKIVLHLTLGSPDSMKTAHWDYCDNVIIRRLGGKNGVSKDFEIARMLTPYGSIFGKGWQFEWTVDVTDFSTLLRDSVEIDYRHSGYEPDTVGWALTLDFEIIKGPEVVKPMVITRLWNGNFKYGDPEAKLEDHLLPVSFETQPGSSISRIRILQTGHGMDEPRGCSEFCSRWREIYYDGQLVQHRALWKDCGNNPLYPQGGTWVYDRADGCPGDLQKPDILNIKASPGEHAVSLKMEPYTATKNIQAVENICAYLVQCSKPLHKVDVSIEQILVPNDRPVYNRDNPAGFGPRIMIRNLGMMDLTSLMITYGTKGKKSHIYQWTGKLSFDSSAEITLPGLIDAVPGINTYEVTLDKPNGRKDEWDLDNSMVSSFTAPMMLPNALVVRMKTNSHPHDNSLLLVNERNDTVYHKPGKTLKADTVYMDTLRLQEGLYRFSLTDTAGDGLEFWAEPDQGNGSLRFLDLQGRLVYAFQSDCGNGEILSFDATERFNRDTTVVLSAFSLYPRKVKDKTELEVVSDQQAKMTVIITIDGKIVERHEYEKVLSGTFPFYLGYLPKGRIVLEALLNGKSCFKGRIFKEL
jgi:hypothetical protein